MKTLRGWQKAIAIIVIILAVLSIGKNFLIQSAITVAIPQVLGTPVKLGSLAVGMLRPVVWVRNFQLYNPPGFPHEVFVDIPEVRVEYNIEAILSKKIHLKLLVLNLKEVIIYKNPDGSLNVDALKITQKKEQAPTGQTTAAAQKPAEQLPLRIDELRLDLGKVVLKDYTQGEQPVVRVFDAGVHDKIYKDINSAQQLATLVLLEAIGPTGIKAAGIYAAATVLGVAFLPAGVAGLMIGKDSGTAEYNAGLSKVFEVTKEVIKKRGTITAENVSEGTIRARVDGANVSVQISTGENKKTVLSVKARKMMMPQPSIAEGIIYQVSQRVK